jgi:AraC-like DNA-binding protein
MNERLPISKSTPLKARFFDYEHFTYPWHFHSEYEIIYIRESTGTRFVGNSIEKYASGDMFLLGSNLPHYLKSDEIYHTGNAEKRVTGTIIQFEEDFMYHAINNYPQFIKIKMLLEDAKRGLFFPKEFSANIIKKLEDIPLKKGITQIINFLTLLQEMSDSKTKQLISSTDFENAGFFDSTRLDKIISFLNKNYNRQISLEEIASIAAMNPAAFCRYFKAKTSKSFTAYISEMRTAYACKLILIGEKNISQISMECGYETISHFNKSFKRNTGYTPTRYKSLMLNQQTG